MALTQLGLMCNWTFGFCKNKSLFNHNSQRCKASSAAKGLSGHPAELSDSVRLLLTDTKSHVFEIYLVLMSIY